MNAQNRRPHCHCFTSGSHAFKRTMPSKNRKIHGKFTITSLFILLYLTHPSKNFLILLLISFLMNPKLTVQMKPFLNYIELKKDCLTWHILYSHNPNTTPIQKISEILIMTAWRRHIPNKTRKLFSFKAFYKSFFIV